MCPTVPDVEEGADAPARPVDWYVIEATETGELIALADVPYELGLDPRSPLNPSSPVATRDPPIAPRGLPNTFAMEHTAEPQEFDVPEFLFHLRALLQLGTHPRWL